MTILHRFETFYEQMLPAQEKSKDVFAWFSGIPHPLFNAVMRCSAEKIDGLIQRAPTNVPLSFWVSPLNRTEELIEALTMRGYKPIGVCPLMFCNVHPVSSTGHDIRPADTKIFMQILGDVNQLDSVVRDEVGKILEKAPTENYLLYVDQVAVGTGTLFINGKTGGIFNMAVLPEHQRKGYGSAMAQFLMKRAHELGLETLLLHSSPEGISLYQKFGFTRALDIELYVQY